MVSRLDRLRSMDAAAPTLSIAQFYAAIEAALAQTIGQHGPLWVEGEISKIAVVNGHCYIDLIDPTDRTKGAGVLGVKCWKTKWGSVRAALEGVGVTLEVGMTIKVRGRVDLYRPRGNLSLIVDEVDVTALLGQLELERRDLLDRLGREGLLGANAQRPLPIVPLRIGLVASPMTEGCKDFLGQLERSPFSFEVLLVPSSVQGAAAPLELCAALDTLAGLDRPVDVVVVVRGGGARADLRCFDDEHLARRIATMAVPVWTGIGHTGDESVADLVAHRRHITPTACGVALVEQVARYWAEVDGAVARLSARAPALLTARLAELQHRRVALTLGAAGELRARRDHLAALGAKAAGTSGSVVYQSHRHLLARIARLAPAAQRQVDWAAEQQRARRAVLDAYDVTRQLERGYSLTYDEHGRLLRGVETLRASSSLTTRTAHGTVTSTVTDVQPDPLEEQR